MNTFPFSMSGLVTLDALQVEFLTMLGLAVPHTMTSSQLNAVLEQAEVVVEKMTPSCQRRIVAAPGVAHGAVDARVHPLMRLATSLQNKHPGAAASMKEGLEETLTLQELGITGALYRTLRTTNPLENLNGSIAHYTRNVKRWKDGAMTLRWVASALSDASGRFRRLRGCGEMKTLLMALDSRAPNSTVQAVSKVA